jgi:hypothetical protein
VGQGRGERRFAIEALMAGLNIENQVAAGACEGFFACVESGRAF